VIDFALADLMALLGMNTPCRGLIVASLVLISTAFTTCGDKGSMPAKGANVSAGATAMPLTSGGVAPILLFNGTGTSAGDVTAVETILNSNHLNYATVNPSQLNEIGESQFREYRLLIVPGGNFVDIGNNLTSSTTANLRNAVQSGLNYLGICAGAFFARLIPFDYPSVKPRWKLSSNRVQWSAKDGSDLGLVCTNWFNNSRFKSGFAIIFAILAEVS
jgi:hypothetical protein